MTQKLTWLRVREMQARWQSQYEAMHERMERQKTALDRMVQANTIMTAALFEIADGEVEPGSMPGVARRAIEAVQAMSPPAAVADDKGQSSQAQTKEET